MNRPSLFAAAWVGALWAAVPYARPLGPVAGARPSAVPPQIHAEPTSRASEPGVASIRPRLATEPVPTDADDPAIWVHPADPSRSLILGTNKTAAPNGALVAFGLDGRIRQTIAGLDRPNNVDVETGFILGGERVDIAVVTERYRRCLRVFRIAPADGMLEEIPPAGGLPVFEGEPGEQGAPMGIALYRRPRDGAVFAIVSRKEGPQEGYLWQYRLVDDGQGGVAAVKVRAFGRFSGAGEVEAVAVDDALGFVYYADERAGIRKYTADPDLPDSEQELALFGTQSFEGDREGIAIWGRGDGTGYLICADQRPGGSRLLFYPRQGTPGRPHDHGHLLMTINSGADDTDGIEVTSTPLGPPFDEGLLVAMNSAGRNFLLYSWSDLIARPAP